MNVTSTVYQLLFYMLFILKINCIFTSEQNDDSYKHYLGTKTPYRIIANLNDSSINFEGCKPSKIWMLVRHGTRNPSAKQIRKIKSRLFEIRDVILQNDNVNINLQKKLKKWKYNVSEEDQKKLTHEGEDEMLNLAKRMQNRFPSVFSRDYSNSSYKFKFTATQRTEESAKYFAMGLFGKVAASSVWFPVPSSKDPILRFYKLCDKWRKEVKKNPHAAEEQIIFKTSEIMNKTVTNINQKLGLTDVLSFDDIHLMYMTCAFETAWNEETESPWCLPFAIRDLRVLEFYEDLKYYWIDGYGHEVTYKQACPAFNNLIEFFKREESDPMAVVYFTHSGTILKMLAHLGIYKENGHLLHDDVEKKTKRKWKVGQIDAFASNLAFVSYSCGQENKILFLHQEKIVKLPSCAKNDLCDFNSIVQYYKESLNNCNFDEMCDISLKPKN